MRWRACSTKCWRGSRRSPGRPSRAFRSRRRTAHAPGETRSAALTQPGVAIGTPDYMSPEQASGQRELDGRCDQYALACVLYEMLAGQPPFTGPTIESILLRQLTVQAPRITDFQPDVPKAVAAALARALAKAPAERFSGMAAL